jgi:opacity protein-like surface antigen
MNYNLKQAVQFAGAILFLLGLPLAGASQDTGMNGPAESLTPESLFARGRYEVGLNNGVLFSPFLATGNRPTINYTYSGLQLGYMLSDVKGDGWWRGNFELAGEAFGSAVFRGQGTYIAGGTLWLRYNFVPRSSALVPYVQAGAGAVSTDVDRDVVGQAFNFNLGVAVGVRYFVARNWSLSLEYRYQHISNANTGPRNVGINADGPILGISYFF